VLVILLNLFTDVIYCYLDPRIKVSKSGMDER
jgi:ABC-type dipeptide/oligopeptide/nickel transport system permease component